MVARRVPVLLIVLLATPLLRAEGEANPVAQKAFEVLKTHCYRCHGENGSVEGGLNYLLDLDKLTQRKKLVPGKADQSPIYKRVAKDNMPPVEVEQRLTDAEKTALKDWIDAGAPPVTPTKRKGFVTQNEVNERILKDLEGIDRRARRFVRYLSLAHLSNSGTGEDELQTYRNALSKLINSLSWHPKIRKPEPIDDAQTILRIDLRWYMWDAALWNRLLNDYPYGLLDDSTTSRAIMVSTGTKIPLIRADWFIATASRPLLYQDLLQLPGNLAELEKQLRVDAGANIAQDRVLRLAFNGSGISKNNRILERHDAVHGYYWRTYDFEEVPQNLIERGDLQPDRRNVFAYPLGPGSTENAFQHAGGEAIFSLPNGLQGYYIMNAVNNRVDKAPQAIVSDPKRPDRAVETGVSCMGCHIPGIISKADQMRDHLDTNPKAIPKLDREIAKAIYPGKEIATAQMEEDAKRFTAALEQTGAKVNKYEPVITMTLRYEADVDAVTAAAEVGLPYEEFQKRIGESPRLSQNFGAFRVAGGTVARQIWVQGFGDVVKQLRLGVLFQSNQLGATLPDNTGEIDPLEAAIGQANHMAFSPDGRRAVIASSDRSVRFYEVEGKRDLKRLIGHTASVWSVALSPDSTRALSGSMDLSVRFWDTATGQQLLKLDGHTSLVTCVAFVPESKKAISGSLDGTVIVWDLATGKEIQQFEFKKAYVNALSVSADGKFALVGANGEIHSVNLDTGKEVLLGSHAAAVTSVAFSKDGTQALSGSDDRTVRLWDLAAGRMLREMKGHEAPVRAVSFNDSGKWGLSGSADSTVRLWQLATGKELGKFPKHAEPVVQVAFLDNGKQTLSGSRDLNLLPWNIEKFSTVSTSPSTGGNNYSPEVKPLELKRKLIPVGGTLSRLILSPDGKKITFVDLTANRLMTLDTESGALTKGMRFPDLVDGLVASPDGKQLVAMGKGAGARGLIVTLDPKTGAMSGFASDLAASPADFGVDNRGNVYFTDEGKAGARVWSADRPVGELAPVNGENWWGAFLGISADEKWVYLSTPNTDNGVLARELPAPNPKFGVQELPSTPEYPVGGAFVLTPDSKFLICKTGTVVSQGEFKAVAKIDPFTAMSVDVLSGTAYLVTPGNWLKEFSYPDWKQKGSWKLPVAAYQAVFDARPGKLYLGVIDPDRIRTNPRSKGFGDLWVIETKELGKEK